MVPSSEVHPVKQVWSGAGHAELRHSDGADFGDSFHRAGYAPGTKSNNATGLTDMGNAPSARIGSPNFADIFAGLAERFLSVPAKD